MLRPLVTVLISLLSLTSQAQTHYPMHFYQNGWNVLGFQIDPATSMPGVIDHYRFFFYGDSTINSMPYHKLYYHFKRYNFNFGSIMPSDSFHYTGAFRESGLEYYFLPTDSINERLMYDFSLNVGDTAPASYYVQQDWDKVIQGTNPVNMLDGSIRTRYSYGWYDTTGATSGWGWYYDGLGDIRGLIDTTLYVKDLYDGGTETYSYCENDSMIYKDSGFGFTPANTCDFPVGINSTPPQQKLTLFPNPASGIVHVEFPNHNSFERLEIIDPLGRTIKLMHTNGNQKMQLDVSELANGIYLVKISGKDQSTTTRLVVQNMMAH